MKSINLSTWQCNPLVTGIDQQLYPPLLNVLRPFPAVVQNVLLQKLLLQWNTPPSVMFLSHYSSVPYTLLYY